LLNKAALVEQYYLVIHADASSGNEGILEGSHKRTGPSLSVGYTPRLRLGWWSAIPWVAL